MLEQPNGGCIINMSSVGGQITGTTPSYSMAFYSAAKAAILSLSRSMAGEFAPKIRVNALMPGLVQTDRTRKLPLGEGTPTLQDIDFSDLTVGGSPRLALAVIEGIGTAWVFGLLLLLDQISF